MAYVIAIANQKGGVGKTTTAINLSAALSRRGYPVLLIDLDPQANATSGLGIPKTTEKGTNDLFTEGVRALDLSTTTHDPGIRVISSNSDLIGIENRLDDLNKHFYLKDSLEDLVRRPLPVVSIPSPVAPSGVDSPPDESSASDAGAPVLPESEEDSSAPIKAEEDAAETVKPPQPSSAEDHPQVGPEESDKSVKYERDQAEDHFQVQPKEWVPHYVILDCPPSLNVITTNALVASDSLLIPVQAEFYALEGLTELLRTFTAVRKRFNPGLLIEGMLLTMFDTRTRLSGAVEGELRKHYSAYVFQTVIPRSVRFGEAPSHGKTIFEYDPSGRGASAYLRLAEEVIAHDPKRAWARTFLAPSRGRTGHIAEPARPRSVALSEDFLRRD